MTGSRLRAGRHGTRSIARMSRCGIRARSTGSRRRRGTRCRGFRGRSASRGAARNPRRPRTARKPMLPCCIRAFLPSTARRRCNPCGICWRSRRTPASSIRSPGWTRIPRTPRWRRGTADGPTDTRCCWRTPRTAGWPGCRSRRRRSPWSPSPDGSLRRRQWLWPWSSRRCETPGVTGQVAVVIAWPAGGVRGRTVGVGQA
jgi:hypothetical protein